MSQEIAHNSTKPAESPPTPAMTALIDFILDAWNTRQLPHGSIAMNHALTTALNLLRDAKTTRPWPHSKSGQRILRATAKAVEAFLNEPGHPFTLRVKDIDWIPASPEAKRCAGSSDEWFYWLFWPMPGAGDPERRGVWKTSLLLFVTALTRSGCDAISAAIPIPTDPVQSLTSDKVKEVIKQFAPQVLDNMASAFMPCLYEAVEDLTHFDSQASQLTIDARHACLGTERVRLSKLQALYLAALIERAPEPVPHHQLRAMGITAPTDLKHKLLAKLTRGGIDAHILTPPRAKADSLVSAQTIPASTASSRHPNP